MINIESLSLEKFEEYGSRISRKISIHRTASFGIPPTFYKENKIEGYNIAQLFFDKVQNVIAIKFVKSEEESGYKINKYGDGDKQAATFMARSFFNKYGINPEACHGKYGFETVELTNVGKLYLIKLAEREVVEE